MTKERFWYDFEDPTGHKILDFKNDKEYPLETIGDFREVADLMNGLNAKNKVLRKEIERLKRQNEDILYNNAKNTEFLEKEEEQLKSKNKILLEHCDDLQERNDRQAKQLDRLYNLIEEKDWKALSDIIDDFKRCEGQLLKEWGNYSV